MQIRPIFVLLVAFLFAWPMLTALRTGRIDLKGGRIDKANYPRTYWAVLAVGVILVIVLIAVGYQALPARFPN